MDWKPIDILPDDYKDGASLGVLGYIPEWELAASMFFRDGQWWIPLKTNGRMPVPPPSFYTKLLVPPKP